MIKLGVIGFSDGNGHPYSWSAIFNGYNKTEMDLCGFPAISDYLSKRLLPEESIKGAKITHVWTQDINLSNHIARATYIEHSCNSLDELIGGVDAVLLARDDWQSHVEIGLKLLKSGKPIYIDKPITVNLKSLKILDDAQKFEGQIFSCSALRFSHQLRLTKNEKKSLGTIQYINSSVPKTWEKYSVHLIDPIVGLFATGDIVSNIEHRVTGEINESQVIWESGLITNFSTFGSLPSKLQFELIGDKSSKTIIWDDAFSSFKAALEMFVHQLKSNNFHNEMSHHQKVVSIIEKGM